MNYECLIIFFCFITNILKEKGEEKKFERMFCSNTSIITWKCLRFDLKILNQIIDYDIYSVARKIVNSIEKRFYLTSIPSLPFIYNVKSKVIGYPYSIVQSNPQRMECNYLFCFILMNQFTLLSHPVSSIHTWNFNKSTQLVRTQYGFNLSIMRNEILTVKFENWFDM